MKDNECHLEIVLGNYILVRLALGNFQSSVSHLWPLGPSDWGQSTQNPQTHFNHERCLGNAVGNTTTWWFLSTHFEDDNVVSRCPRLDRPIVIWMSNAPCGLMPLNTWSQLVVLFGTVLRLLGGGGTGRGGPGGFTVQGQGSSPSILLPGFGHIWPASMLTLPPCLPLLSSPP